jgi:DNA invertase Pin-like site-specific DNA recombinase
MIRQRIRAALRTAAARANSSGEKGVDLALKKRIQSQLSAGKGMLAVARECGVGTGTVQRTAREMAARRPFDGVSVAA